MMSHVLIVAYYWPPAGGPGVQRWLSMSKHLFDLENKVTVLVPKNANYPIIDESLNKQVHGNINIIQVKIFEPFYLINRLINQKSKQLSSGIIPEKKQQSFLESLLLWIRGNFFIPDSRLFWIRPAVKKINQLLKEQTIHTIITTGPPHSVHLIGQKIKYKHPKIQWITDFRDPWTTIGYHSALYLKKSSEAKHLALEKQILQSADKILVTSQVTKEEFMTKTSKPIKVITNGFDDQDNLASLHGKFANHKFSLAHIGSWLTERNPAILWQVLAELVSENKQFAALLEIRIAGKTSEIIFKQLQKNNLSYCVVNYGYLNHNEVVTLQKESTVLLLIEIDKPETKGIIPGKLFEYLISNRPIIAIGPQGSAIKPIIESTNTGKYFNYYQKQDLKHSILKLFEAFLTKNLAVNAIGVNSYHRRNLTKALLNFIEA